MIARYSSVLSLLFLMSACAPQSEINATAPPVQDNALTDTTLASDIRPGPNGPKLELTDLEGELLIPSGTSAFVIQSQSLQVAQVSMGQIALRYLIPPAHAQDNTQEETGDALIELSDVKKLKATVNEKEVLLEILKLEDVEEGQLVSYRLKDVIVTENSAVVEFKSPTGGFEIRGLVEKIDKQTKKLDQRFDLDSTALSYVWEALQNNRPEKLTRDTIDRLKDQAAVQDIKKRIYEHYVDPSFQERKIPRPVKDVLQQEVSRVLEESPVRSFLEAKQKCLQNRSLECALPPLPQGNRQPLPPELVNKVRQRQERQRRLTRRNGNQLMRRENPPQQAPPPNLPQNTSSVSDAKLSLLLKQPINVRRKTCIANQIYPCPGLK